MQLEKASKSDLIRTFSGLTVKKIVENNYPSIGSLSKEYGEEMTEKVMGIILHDLSASFNGILNNEIVEEICIELSSSILRNISLEDLYMACREIKYMKHHGKLDLNKVLKVIQEQFDERCNYISEKNLNEHLSKKANDPERSRMEHYIKRKKQHKNRSKNEE